MIVDHGYSCDIFMDLLILVSLYRPSIIIIIILVMYFRPAGLSGKQEREEGG